MHNNPEDDFDNFLKQQLNNVVVDPLLADKYFSAMKLPVEIEEQVNKKKKGRIILLLLFLLFISSLTGIIFFKQTGSNSIYKQKDISKTLRETKTHENENKQSSTSIEPKTILNNTTKNDALDTNSIAGKKMIWVNPKNLEQEYLNRVDTQEKKNIDSIILAIKLKELSNNVSKKIDSIKLPIKPKEDSVFIIW